MLLSKVPFGEYNCEYILLHRKELEVQKVALLEATKNAGVYALISMIKANEHALLVDKPQNMLNNEEKREMK